MTSEDLQDIILCGETTTVQFKQNFTTQKKIADEMVAFANSRGGMIIFGVEDKTGNLCGLTYDELQTTSRELGNAANEQIRPTIYIETEVVKIEEKHFLVCHVKEGNNKPYKNLTGEIWVKQGSDKRRVTENSEILSLFQQSQKYNPDQEGIPDSSVNDIDTLALDRFFERTYQKRINEFTDTPETLLRNIHITDSKGQLTTAGALFFAQNPQQFRPVDVIKAVWFVGNSPLTTEYHSSKDIEGTMPEMFEQAMMWLKSCLQSKQDGQSVNSIGKLEIPEIVLEETLQNALVHRDLLKPAAIRLLVFDNRIEIINPGSLAGGLTIEEIKLGNSFARNPLLANFCSKTMTYRGLGFGVPRSLKEDVRVEFENDDSGNQFITRIWRTEKDVVTNTIEDKGDVAKDVIEELTVRQRNIYKRMVETGRTESIKGNEDVVRNVATNVVRNYVENAKTLSVYLNVNERTVQRDLAAMQAQGIIKHNGPTKAGYWEIKLFDK